MAIISNNFILAGLVPFVLLMFLNLRILISLRKLRSRLSSTFSENNPEKGKMETIIQNMMSLFSVFFAYDFLITFFESELETNI